MFWEEWKRKAVEKAENAMVMALQLLALLAVVSLVVVGVVALSFVLCFWVKSLILPQRLLSEKLHFNFESKRPKARIDLLSPHKQWVYLDEDVDIQTPLSHRSTTPNFTKKKKKKLEFFVIFCDFFNKMQK